MPPEPLPWDRKDFFKERKHERSETTSSSFGGGSTSRWKDFSYSSSSHYGSSRDFNRWGPHDFRRPPGAFSLFLAISLLLFLYFNCTRQSAVDFLEEI
jgi:hypothetical protein